MALELNYTVFSRTRVAMLLFDQYATGGVFGGDVEPCVLSQAYRIAEADSGRASSTQLTREMKLYITSF